MTIYILDRANLQELGRLGRSGCMAGDLPTGCTRSAWILWATSTPRGSDAKRIQRFIHWCDDGRSGTGSPVVGGVAAENK